MKILVDCRDAHVDLNLSQMHTSFCLLCDDVAQMGFSEELIRCIFEPVLVSNLVRQKRGCKATEEG